MIKVKPATENLTEANLEKVIKLLEQEKPITKKAACEILGIAYNTTRLGTLIEKHKNIVEHRAKRRKEKLGKPADPDEIQYVIKEYLNGASISAIGQDLYRGATFIYNILEANAVPVRQRTQNYFKPELIPEPATRNAFALGEKVWSARYDSLARVDALVEEKSEKVYRIYLLDEKWKMNAYQPASELASLEHLTKLGIKF